MFKRVVPLEKVSAESLARGVVLPAATALSGVTSSSSASGSKLKSSITVIGPKAKAVKSSVSTKHQPLKTDPEAFKVADSETTFKVDLNGNYILPETGDYDSDALISENEDALLSADDCDDNESDDEGSNEDDHDNGKKKRARKLKPKRIELRIPPKLPYEHNTKEAFEKARERDKKNEEKMAPGIQK